LVAELVQQTDCETATTQQYDRNNGNDHGGIVLLGFFGNGGHLVVHDFFSCLKKLK